MPQRPSEISLRIVEEQAAVTQEWKREQQQQSGCKKTQAWTEEITFFGMMMGENIHVSLGLLT